MLAAWPWNHGRKQVEDENDIEDHPIHEGFSEDEHTEHTPHHRPVGSTTNKPTHATSHPPVYHQTTPKPVTTTRKSELSPPQEVDESDNEDYEAHGGHHGDGHHGEDPHGDGHHGEDHHGDGHHGEGHHGEDPHGEDHHGQLDNTTEWNPMKVPNNSNKKGVKSGEKRPNKGDHRISSDEDTSVEWVSAPTTESTGIGVKGKLQKLVNTHETTLSTTTQEAISQPEDVALHELAPKNTVPSLELTSVKVPDDYQNTPVDPLVGDVGETHLTETQKEVCETPTCKSISARMLAFIDHSKDPCKDFYSFSCGSMAADDAHWIVEDNAESRVQLRISEMLDHVNESSPNSYKKFKSFYETCLHYDEPFAIEDRVLKVREVLESIGRYYTKSEWELNPGNLTNLLGILLQHHFAPLFDIQLDVGSKDNSKFAIKLTAPITKSPFGDQSGTALNGWPSETCRNSAILKPEDGKTVDFNERYQTYAECNKNYQQYLKEVMEAINDTNMVKLMNDSATKHALSDIKINLDMSLSARVNHNPSKKRTLKAKEFKLYTISELTKKYPMINWKALISMLIGDVPENSEIQVYFESYFKSFFKKLSDTSINQRELYNSLLAMFTHELYYGFVKSRSSCDRRNYCLSVARDLMDPIASALFLQSYHSDELAAFKSKITTIFNNLVTSFKAEISTLPWMDPNSGTKALNKLMKLKLYADGGVSFYKNVTFLDSEYSQVAIGKSYLDNAIKLMKRYRERLYQVHKKNPSHPQQIWSNFLLPYDTAGIVIYGLNSIVIPYGMMSKPFFSEEFPLSIQMSGLGFMIAHEIWHHFDTTGMRYGLFDQNDTLSQAIMQKINSTVECAFDQYVAPLHHTGADGITFKYKVNPLLSLNERLADSGGAHLGFQTIWSHSSSGDSMVLPWSTFTPKQLYFISMAQNFCTKSSAFNEAVSLFEDVHLPPFWRVNDIAYNSEEFAEVFSCPESSKLHCKPFTQLR